MTHPVRDNAEKPTSAIINANIPDLFFMDILLYRMNEKVFFYGPQPASVLYVSFLWKERAKIPSVNTIAGEKQQNVS